MNANPTISPADLAAQFDAEIAAEKARQARGAAEAARKIEELRDALDAAILAAANEAGIGPEYIQIEYGSNKHARQGSISLPGFAPIAMHAHLNPDGKIFVAVWFGGSSYGRASTDAIRGAMMAARRRWLEREAEKAEEEARDAAEKAQRQAEQAERHQHDTDALAAWAPLYQQYVIDLCAAHRHNAAILAPIAEKHAGRKFRAARLTYGITADEADPTTETIWIADGDDPDGYFREIDGHGRIEVTRIWHPVKCSEWHIYTASDTFYSGGNYPPPVRRTMIRTGTGNWEIIAPPSACDLSAEIEQEIAGRLAAAPARPDLPALWRPINGEELAWQIEMRIVTDEDERAALAGYFAGDFPSADPIPF